MPDPIEPRPMTPARRGAFSFIVLTRVEV